MTTLASLAHFAPQRFFSYHSYIRRRFGRRIHRVTIDAGFTCPNRDGTAGTGGCTYCNNDGFSPASNAYRPRIYMQPTANVRSQIMGSLSKLQKRYKTDAFFAYFQAYSNTYAPLSTLERLYAEALSVPGIVGLIIGTRPDCVDREKLDYLEQLARETYVCLEYGCESVHDKTLEWVHRGHNYACFVDAVHETAGRGIDVGAHVILGFPTETRNEMLMTADELSRLPIQAVKIHNLHIVKDTALAHVYRNEPFPILSKEEYVELVCDFIERLSPRIAIERLYGDAPLDMMITPTWSTTGNEFSQIVQSALERRNTFQGVHCISESAATVNA